MKKTIKRVLSIVIAFTMLTALIPYGLYADGLDAQDSVTYYEIADAPIITDNDEEFIYNDITPHTDTTALIGDVQGAAAADFPPAFTLEHGREKVLHLRDLNLREGHDFDANPVAGLAPTRIADVDTKVNNYGGITIDCRNWRNDGRHLNILPLGYARNASIGVLMTDEEAVKIIPGDILRIRIRNIGDSDDWIIVESSGCSIGQHSILSEAMIYPKEERDITITIALAHLNSLEFFFNSVDVHSGIGICAGSTSEPLEIVDILIDRDPHIGGLVSQILEGISNAENLLNDTVGSNHYGLYESPNTWWVQPYVMTELMSVVNHAINFMENFTGNPWDTWNIEYTLSELQRAIQCFYESRQQGFHPPPIGAFSSWSDERMFHLRHLNLQEGHDLDANPIRGLAPAGESETDVKVNDYGAIIITVPDGESWEHWRGLDIVPFVEGGTPDENFEIKAGDVLRIRVRNLGYNSNIISVQAGSDSEQGLTMGSQNISPVEEHDIRIIVTQAHLDAAKNDNSEYAHNNFRIRGSEINTTWEIGDILIEHDPRIPEARAAGNAAREAVLALIPEAPLPHNYSMTHAEEFKNAINDLNLEHPLIDISSSFSISGTTANNRRLNIQIEFAVIRGFGERTPIIPPVSTTVAIAAEGTPQPTPTTAPQPTPTAPATITVTQGFARQGETTQVGIRLDRNPGFSGMFLRVELPEGLTLVSYEVTNPELENGISMAQVGGVMVRTEVIIARYIVGHVLTIDKEAADLNGDGKVDTLDLTILGRWLVGIESPN